MGQIVSKENTKTFSLVIGIIYAVFILSIINFWLFLFYIPGYRETGDWTIGNSILKSTFFLYHFYISSLLICIMSFIILGHSYKPFFKKNEQKNRKTDIVLFSILSLGFLGFIIALPMLYLWIPYLKQIINQQRMAKIKARNQELEKNGLY